ncbi:MAG: AraC family transcriptional regulator [Deltaproteobacteria bacterium]|nr:AraC family transcriptional regulator [Deltaproteobacteria bacterium]
MKVHELAALATTIIDREPGRGERALQPLPGLLLLRVGQPTPLVAALYEPVVCLILQGRKETMLGDQTVGFGPGESLVVSHDVPVVSRVTQASPASPYLALIFTLDLAVLRGLYEEVGEARVQGAEPRSLHVAQTDPRLLDSLARYLAVTSDPVEAKVMVPMLQREIHFRLLMAPHGAMLRKLLRHDSHASGIARAIARIRRDFKGSISVPELARETGMSPSSFHKHFKTITSTTPLQYQKELRLLEARRLLSTEGQSVSRVAFEVGYESPNQFSREYTRKFGGPPRRDMATPRAGA